MRGLAAATAEISASWSAGRASDRRSHPSLAGADATTTATSAAAAAAAACATSWSCWGCQPRCSPAVMANFSTVTSSCWNGVTSTRMLCPPAVRLTRPFWVGSNIGVKDTTCWSSMKTVTYPPACSENR